MAAAADSCVICLEALSSAEKHCIALPCSHVSTHVLHDASPSLAQSLRPSVGADGNVDLQEEPLATRKEVVGHAQNVVPNGFRMVFDTEKFEEANSTENCGLGVNTRDGDSQHLCAPLFQRAEYALHELNAVATRHVEDEALASLLHRLHPRRRPFFTALH